MELLKYKNASRDLRRYSSNLFRTDVEEALINLKRLKKFIDENEIISDIVKCNLKNVVFDFNEYLTEEDGYFYKIVVPVDEKEHFKAEYDLMTYLCETNVNMLGVAHKFQTGSKKYNDRIQSFMEKAFKHMVYTISDILSKEMMCMEEKREKNNNGITINGNISGQTSIINGQQNSNNMSITYSLDNKEEVNKLISDIKEMISKSDLNEEDSENIMDDIELIEEELNKEAPKPKRVLKFASSIKTFFLEGSDFFEQHPNLFEKINELIEKLQLIFGIN